MSWGNRMDVAKDALQLFVRSIPKGSSFSIVSFGGGKFKAFSIHGQTVIPYSESSMQNVLDEIKEFEADFSGGDIYSSGPYEALKYA